MANEITPPGTAPSLRTPRSKSVTDKQKNLAQEKKKHQTDTDEPTDKKNSDDDGQIHIDEYI
ncbi:hypothetical protein A9Q89_08540 [Gammaproteobacteria bacterium 53_120_T64]|nr:hypothetical protein A9Q89_08540 [Gammaproteobacteria bacterium 53_120_T64]